MATSDRAPATGAPERCPECAGSVDTTGIESHCIDCGLVVKSDPIDRGPDWTCHADDETNPERAKPGNRNFADRGLGSAVGTPAERDPDTAALVRWHDRAAAGSKKDRNRGYATTEIDRLAGALELGDDLGEQAKCLFRQLHEDEDACGGRDLDTLAAACVYAITRVHQRGRTPGEVAEHARDVDADTLARRHRWLCDTLDLAVPPPDPRQRLRLVASRADVPSGVTDRALARLDGLDDCVVYRGSPSTLAAALLAEVYDHRTRRELAEAAGVTPAAVRNRLEAIGSDAAPA